MYVTAKKKLGKKQLIKPKSSKKKKMMKVNRQKKKKNPQKTKRMKPNYVLRRTNRVARLYEKKKQKIINTQI